MQIVPSINPEKETRQIVNFLRKTFQQQGFKKVVIGISGGVDSTTCLYLLKKIFPAKNIIAVSLPLPTIKPLINPFTKTLGRLDKIRLGNIMARVRMIILFDLAKKHHALVCGTENKTEHLLGYFTRFGDSASDIEPIRHLYKTQVYQLAKYLGVPKETIEQKPTAGLWSGQTDEAEFGFTYKEADNVLYLYFDKKKTVEEIKKLGFKNAEKIIVFAKKNQFKHRAPYIITK